MDNPILLDVIDEVRAEWYKLGLRMGQKIADLENFRTKAVNDNYTCCTWVVNYWINNHGHPPHYPLSWNGLYDVLVAIGHSGTAENMRTKLARF